MCGIFTLVGDIDNDIFLEYFGRLSNRGPDNRNILTFPNIMLGFHRLSIVDTSDNGNQPLKHKDKNIWVICNGEIYNHKSIITTLKADTSSSSDCEAILYLYEKYGIDETVQMLDGVFAFILYDQDLGKMYIARDPFGVRPLFIGKPDSGDFLIFSSEMKAILNSYRIKHIEPGTYSIVDIQSLDRIDLTYITSIRYYYYNYPIKFRFESVCEGINMRLKNAVNKRLMSDRPIGCLLSGGLDSSLVAGITAQLLKENLHTFSIGMKNSPDIKYANMVSNYIGSTHHEIVLSKDQFLRAIPEVIQTIESYDVTTVRASVGHYLLARYIKQATDITVVLGGEGSDEVCGGYRYFKKAPNPDEFDKECKRLLTDIHMYDVLRADRAVSSRWSLEARVPFLDKEFVEYYLSIPPSLRYGGNKTLLRESFMNDDLIPKEVLMRPKEAFSDGVSAEDNSWHNIINKHLEDKISNSDVPDNMTKEAFYYFEIFCKQFGTKNTSIIPYKWMPKKEWVGEHKDPSARELNY